VKTNETLHNHPVVTQRALSTLTEDFLNIRLLMKELVFNDGSLDTLSYLTSMDTYSTDIKRQLDTLSVSYLGPKSNLEILTDKIQVYDVARLETIRLVSVGKIEEAKLRVMYDGVDVICGEEVLTSITVMEDFARDKSTALYLAAQQEGVRIGLINLFFVFTIVFTTSLVLIKLRKSIMKPLKELKGALDNFEQGNISSRSLLVSKNEVGIIANSFNLMKDRIEKNNSEIISKEVELLAAKAEISSQAELLEIQKAFYLEKQLYQATLLSIGDAVISCDVNSNVLFLNRSAEILTGWKQEDAIGKLVESIFNIVHERTREICEDIVSQVILSKSKMELDMHTMLISKDGSERPIEDSAAPIFDKDGELAGVVLIFRDVTEQRKAINNIEYLSYHDKLTDLYNRRFYEEEIRRLDTERNLPLTIIMGDVNGLKLINDSFGHSMGDELLQKVAKTIKLGFRSDEIIARLGGDEFVVILPNTDKAEVERIISRIQSSLIEDTFMSFPISISFGHSTKENIDQNIQEVFKNAEDDMYKQKLYESSSMRSRTVDLIMNTLYEKNMREMLHSKRVGDYCEALAIKMNFDAENINKIRLAGLMHDIGKIAIDEKILNKIEQLTKLEFDEIKRHSEIGYRILSSVNEFSEIATFVLEHHERWDGLGYPKGLMGNEISIQGRIVCITDAFDAMTRDRTYKRKLSIMEAIKELRKFAGSQFDPDIIEDFIEVVLEMNKNELKQSD
jgi:diguanylate cyclase (GGDEF)-like protein/PAS domain S-box-containing protein/putative nucleotidyltransferase with HDIG domain